MKVGKFCKISCIHQQYFKKWTANKWTQSYGL